MKNYHTHTNRCHHASGTDEEYILHAIEGGFTVLGFADHSPWKYDSSFVPRVRMTLEEFEDYYKSILHLKEKYKDQIVIKLGLEAEYYEKYMDWMKEFVKEYKIDYLVFGNHFYETDETGDYYGSSCVDDKMLEAYVESTIKGLETGLYCYLAHPDLFLRTRKWDKKCEEASHKICKYCEKNDVIIEYNLAGLRSSISKGYMQYPHDEFWKIASTYNIKAIIGVDAHAPKQLSDPTLYNYALEKLKDWNIEVVEDIQYFDWK